MGELLPVCEICAHTPDRGIAEGICICGSFICRHCEQEIADGGLYDAQALRRLARKLKKD